MSTLQSATPLVSLNAVIVDTETTGPDASTARVIQIGAVRLRNGRVEEQGVFDMLVNPGIPIPASSTAIHGITDADVTDAADFRTRFEAFREFAGKDVLIGHSIGFDLAVLKRECALAGIDWKRPRTLCTRLLARVAKPSLHDFSMEMLAGLFGVTIEDRHSALGDAVATAKLFVAMVPLLRAQNIRTLAEAEEAIKALADDNLALLQAGWEDAVHTAAREQGVLTRIDAYPYRHRVKDIMSAPPLFVSPEASLGELLRIMMDKKVSSVFVGAPRADAAGIVTERDVLRAIAAKDAGALADKAGEVMSKPLASVRAEAFIYRALARMDRLYLRHLAVVDDAGTIIGALTSRNLLRLRASEAVALGDEIETAENAAMLAGAWPKVPAIAEHLIAEAVDARDVASVISREICAMTRRAAELGEARLKDSGKGPPPRSYAVMVLGSGGRGESLLAPDQDNAIVYEGDEDDAEVDRWFEELGIFIADTLDAAGIPYCKGGVMAKNAAWRHSMGGWRVLVGDWVRRSRPEDLLNVDIFFDAKPVFGKAELADALFSEAYGIGGQAPDFLKLLAQAAADFKPPLGMFGGFQASEGRVDLKRGGLLPIVTTARILSIRYKVRQRSTAARLQGLIDAGIGAKGDLSGFLAAHGVILRQILMQQIEDLREGRTVSNRIAVKSLTRSASSELKEALRAIAHADTLAQDLLFARA